VSYFHVQKLAPVDDEFEAARASMEYIRDRWARIRDEPEFQGIELAHLRAALDRVEATYLIRLFAEFEAILQEHLAVAHPGMRIPRIAEALINRVALRERIPTRSATRPSGSGRSEMRWCIRAVKAGRPPTSAGPSRR
jgi:hypothetical protein